MNGWRLVLVALLAAILGGCSAFVLQIHAGVNLPGGVEPHVDLTLTPADAARREANRPANAPESLTPP